MDDSAAQISSKIEDSSQQARIPAPATDNIDTNHDIDAKKLAHAPAVYVESDQAASRLGNPGNHDWNAMTPEEKADAKKLAHAPPFYVEPDQANPGAFRVGGQDNDDGHTITSEGEVRSHGVTAHTFQVSARLVEEDPELDIVVAVLAKDNKKRLIYISIGVLGISVVLATVLGVTLSPAPTPSQRDSMMTLIQSGMAETSFSNSSSPQSQALDWILADPYSSDGLSGDLIWQRFALATIYYSTNGDEWRNHNDSQWLSSSNECLWDSNDIVCSPELKVEGLDLERDGLSGRIPNELGLLTQLSSLSLSDNQLAGSIPSGLRLLTQLEDLDFSNNQLIGSLPSELGLLIQLSSLSFGLNQLTDSLPSELGLLTQLTVLDLYTNQLTGSLPSELGLLTNLTWVDLFDNTLTGSLPSSLCSAGVDSYIYLDCEEIACTCCLSGDDSFPRCPS